MYQLKEEEIDIHLAPNDEKALRNKNKLISLYQELINDHKGHSATSKYLTPGYIQHNPSLPTTAAGTAEGFVKMYELYPNFHVKVLRIIAMGNYTWSHVNFLGYTDNPNDRGKATVDIFRFNDEGMIEEHWDVVQPVPDPSISANNNGMF